MNNYFEISGHFMSKHKIACDHSTLNIEDCRFFEKEYQSDVPNMVLNDKIHYKFFEQLTLQISPQISKLLKKEFEKDSILTFTDRYFVVLDGKMYILLYLNWTDGIGDYLWVKSNTLPDCFTDIEDGPFDFELCNEEETARCQLIRFGYTSQYWVDYIKYSFSLCLQKRQMISGRNSYPDVIIICVFAEKVSSELKNRLLDFVTDFISTYNSNAQEGNIHYCQLVNSRSLRKILLHIDFGNCESMALQSLLNALTESEFGIKKIIIK